MFRRTKQCLIIWGGEKKEFGHQERNRRDKKSDSVRFKESGPHVNLHLKDLLLKPLYKNLVKLRSILNWCQRRINEFKKSWA